MSETLLREAWQWHRAGDHARAERLYKDILRREPRNFDALYRLGFLFGERGRLEDAERMMGEAIKLDPSSADAHFLRGSALLSLERLEEAIGCFDRTLAIHPDLPEALLNRASALFRLKRYADAAQDYDRLLQIVPDFPYALGNRLFCRLHVCNWSSRDADIAAIAAGLRLGKRVIAPFDAKALSLSTEDELRCANIWSADQIAATGAAPARRAPYHHDRIRIAYLAADFGDDPVSMLLAGVLESHDRDRFEITGVSLRSRRPSAMQARLRRAFDRQVDASRLTDAEAAALLAKLEIDIAIDLMGFTEGCRPGILAWRSAPVQVNYLGFPGTMGTDFIDYIVGDRTVIPEAQRADYSEAVVYLPDSYLCNDDKRRIADRTPARADAGLPETGFVFASFNNTYKFSPAMFDIWMRLLHAVEKSVLWLPQSSALAMRNLWREAEARGITPDRLVFAAFMPAQEDHLARLRQADLFLDTLSYNAHTTAADALWAGLPVLTCMGVTFAGRVAASLNYAVGLPELVTQSLADYEARALEFVRNPDQLSRVKAKLAQNRVTHPLFDTARFTRHLETAYTAMWERAARGEPPASFAVEAA